MRLQVVTTVMLLAGLANQAKAEEPKQSMFDARLLDLEKRVAVLEAKLAAVSQKDTKKIQVCDGNTCRWIEAAPPMSQSCQGCQSCPQGQCGVAGACGQSGCGGFTGGYAGGYTGSCQGGSCQSAPAFGGRLFGRFRR